MVCFSRFDDHPAGARKVDHRLHRVAGIRGEDVLPAAVGRNLAHVEHRVREVGKKLAGPDLALGAVGDDAKGDLAERLIGVGDGLDHHPGRGRRGERRQQQDRAEQPQRTDAAGHHDDDLAVGGEAAEGDQDGDEQGHRNGQPELRGNQRQHQPRDNRPGDALGDQDLRLLDEERDDQQEGQNDQRDHEGKQDLPDDVAVDQAHREVTRINFELVTCNL